jgi:hypothetical protein
MSMQKYETQNSGAMISFGQEHMDASDFIPPRVKVLQAMSQETTDERGVVGDFYNTLTGENYGKTLRFIPLTTFKNRLLIVRPERRDEINKVLKGAGVKSVIEGDGLQCRSLDTVQGVGVPGMECADCPLSQWVGRFPPLCSHERVGRSHHPLVQQERREDRQEVDLHDADAPREAVDLDL